ncbi:MAG TPA: hypothetical protein VD813_10580, partial [Pseudonocardia sp.]|nr:hypothetical protein [Pseudonocardia sp.]
MSTRGTRTSRVRTQTRGAEVGEARIIPLHADTAGGRARTRPVAPSRAGEPWQPEPVVPEPTPEVAAGPGPEASEWEEALAEVLAFLRRRTLGDYPVDDFGFDADLTDNVLIPALRPLYRSWFRVETIGMHHVPDTGGALVVA